MISSKGSPEPTSNRVRVDVWLWRARQFKTRTEAGRFVAEGRVRLERGGIVRRIDKPAALIGPGDSLIFARGDKVMGLCVLGIGWRRGAPSEARSLYSDSSLQSD